MVEAEIRSLRVSALYTDTQTPVTIRSYPKPEYTPLTEIFKEIDGKAIKTIIDTIREQKFYEEQNGVAQGEPEKHCRTVYEISARASNINCKLERMGLNFNFDDILKDYNLVREVRESDRSTTKCKKKLVKYIDTTLQMIEREGRWLKEVKGGVVDALKTKSKQLKKGIYWQGGRIPAYTLPEIALLFNPITLPYGVSILISAGGVAIKDLYSVSKKYSERKSVKKAVEMTKNMGLGAISSLLVDVGCYSKWRLDKEIDSILNYEDTIAGVRVKKITKSKLEYLYNKIPLPPKLANFMDGAYQKVEYMKSRKK